jgi:hypothetical protein
VAAVSERGDRLYAGDTMSEIEMTMRNGQGESEDEDACGPDGDDQRGRDGCDGEADV